MLATPLRLFLVAAAVAFLAIAFKPTVSADGVGYFVYLHAVVVDHNLDMTREYAEAIAAHAHIGIDVSAHTVTGLPPDQFSIGPALLSLPAYLLALLMRPTGEPQFGPPFTFAYTLASLLYGALALALAYRLLRHLEYSRASSLIAVVALAFCTPLLYYLVYSPSYSHTFSAFTVTLFVYVWWTRRDHRTIAGWIVLGLIGGLMALVRWLDGPLIAIAFLDVPRAKWRPLLMAPGALLAFSPQFVVDEIIFGKLLPGAPSVSFNPWPGHYLDVMFSSLHGLFIWSPALLAAVAGYWFVRNTVLRAAFAMSFLIQLAIVGSFVYWYGGFSFGMRFFLNLTPFFAIGLAAVATRLRPAVAWVALAAMSAWSFLLTLSLTYLLKEDVVPGYAGLMASQVRAVAYLPHLAQGYVVRSYIAGASGRAGDVAGATVLLLLEAMIVATAVAFAASTDRPPGHVVPQPEQLSVV